MTPAQVAVVVAVVVVVFVAWVLRVVDAALAADGRTMR